MATLSSISSINAGATAHINVQPDEAPKPTDAPAVPVAVAPAAPVHQQEPTTLPPEGMVLAEAMAYRTVDRKFLSHTSGVVVQEPVVLKLVPGGLYQLICSPSGRPQEVYVLDPADWELRPEALDQITTTVHTLKAASATTKEVLLAGEFEGEDLPLYDIEIKYRGGLRNALLHPNQPGALHKLEEGQSKLVRLGFEALQEAQEWHALLNICMGGIDLNSPALASLPRALAASRKVASFREMPSHA